MERLVYEAPKDSFSPLYPPCLFQYVDGITTINKYSIVLSGVHIPKLCTESFCICHCSWDDKPMSSSLNAWELHQPENNKGQQQLRIRQSCT